MGYHLYIQYNLQVEQIFTHVIYISATIQATFILHINIKTSSYGSSGYRFHAYHLCNKKCSSVHMSLQFILLFLFYYLLTTLQRWGRRWGYFQYPQAFPYNTVLQYSTFCSRIKTRRNLLKVVHSFNPITFSSCSRCRYPKRVTVSLQFQRH